jgi:hypothetical protein
LIATTLSPLAAGACHSRRQLLAKAAIAGRRVAVGWRAALLMRKDEGPHPQASYVRHLALKIRPTTSPSANTSKSSSLYLLDERSCGLVIEGAYAVCGDQLHVRDHEGKSWTVALKPGDNPEILARKLLREKFGKHHAFNQPIHYPPRSYH